MGLQAERMDMLPHFPQLHLILAELFARKSNYAIAIAELQTYLELVPHAPNAPEARDRLAELEKLTAAAPQKQN
jgi:regulator of sirC expression with transglutaminase-like and TPR domain